MIIGSEEVRTRQVKGAFSRYTYFCNGFESYVYCQTKETFLALICEWNRQGVRSNHLYTMISVEGAPISLEDIVKDQSFKIKVLLNFEGKEEYIQ